jgi:Tol biopolymer transport system component
MVTGGVPPLRPWWQGWRGKAALAVGVVVLSMTGWYWLARRGEGVKDASTLPGKAAFTQLTDQPGEELFPSLSPDGKSFIYASYASGNWDIYLQRVGGQKPINLTKDSPAHDTQPAFSPDGEQIAFRSERDGGGIFIMGATGESVRRLTDFGHNPAWSPDGKHIICATDSVAGPEGRYEGSQLWSITVATSQKQLIPTGDAVQPSWSPQGDRIAYWGIHKGGQRDLWTVPANGGPPIQVTDDAFVDWNPVWSPDGQYLYFASNRGGSMNLWRLPIEERTGEVQGPPESVTTPSPYSQHLSFSRDGQRLAYVQEVNRANIQQVGFDPSTETIIGQPTWITQGSRPAENPDWSPDGEWIVFAMREPQEDLFVIRRDGTGLRQLTNDVHKDRVPRWSPDGKQITFYSDRSGRYQVWVVSSDGSGLRQLMNIANANVYNPMWSPDGTHLVFGALMDVSKPLSKGFNEAMASARYALMDVSKPWDQQTLDTLPPFGDPPLPFTPFSWSADGKTLAGQTRTSGIAVFSLESRRYHKLTDFGGSPRWLSDSRRLMFLYQGKLYLLDTRAKKSREILSPASQPVGRFSISLDNRLICYDVSTSESDVWLMTLE